MWASMQIFPEPTAIAYSLQNKMRLPRRVPWETLSELEQVCSWIYTDENDFEATQRAVNRVGFPQTPLHTTSLTLPSAS